ncbi:gliding motility-associated C-terminal domain-containing protein [Algoriphagus halophytocola]|uniref:Ig-like domain-containing protein n=1 Tax=Algoriphagus halophytocola TaxID=2991499 RepID=UPI0022DE4406|nr:gliding motility-associated C-terminal domain-containing protein [Algoriphagus sp. TR-M9]WBL44160.1 gliding motility-associated C-terminal domain-containing protein [Algoriphagus sp. TR-M9]
MIGLSTVTFGQSKDFATWTPSSGVITTGTLGNGGAGVSDVANASNNSDSDFATLTSSSLSIIAGGNAWLQVKFPTDRLPGTTTFVKIDLPNASGLNLLDLLGLVNENIAVSFYSGAGDSSSDVGGELSTSVDSRLVVDSAGDYFLAVTPESTIAYNSVRILLEYPGSLLGLGSFNLNVYNAFTLVDPTCAEAEFADIGQTAGINISLLGGDLVTNPENAIDGDIGTYSSVSYGGLVNVSAASSVFQTFYFNGLWAPEDYFKVTLAIDGGLVDLNLLGDYEVRAYDGDDLVFASKLSSGIIGNLELVGLIQSGDPVTLAFGPGVSFDRVSVGLNSTVDLGVASSPLRIYEVARYGTICPDPDPLPAPDATDPMLSSSDCEATLIDFENANFPFNAVDGNNDTFTTLQAGSGTLLGAGAFDGQIQLGFDQRSAGTTSYIRIDFDEEALLGLLDGSLGDVLNGVGGSLLGGDKLFRVEALNGASSVLSASTDNGFFNQPVRIVQDKNNHYYIALTPTAAYTSVRVTLEYPGLIGGASATSMNVYHVCTSTGFEECEQAFSTFAESAGISLDLLGLGAAGVSDAGFAIDGDPATASEISLGAAGIGSSIYQFVDFHTLSASADHFRVKLALEGGNTLTAEVLGSIVIKAFDGDTEVYSQDLRDGLISGLDLLGLLQSGQTINLPFGPGLAFDRVAVGIESLVSANVIQNPVRVFSIERFSDACPDPELPEPPQTEPPFNTSDCAVEVVDWENANFPLNTVDGNNDSYAILSASAGTALGLGAYSSHIELKYAAPVAAGETSYVRIEFEDDELNALLGGSLGSDLANLLGTVALGDHYFTVTPKTAGGSDIYTASSATGFGTQDVRVVQDESGRFYIAFTADQAYQSVRIDHFLTALIGVENTATMHVFSMCRETEFDLCEQATFTDFDGDGIALDLLDITQGGVFNPQNAIDGNSSNYSTINLGVAGIGASVYQNIYFKTKSQATDALRIRVQLDEPGILNLDLAGSYRVILYDGNEEVYNESLQDALINNLDLLGLLNSGGIQELMIEPGVVYDRVSFGLESAVAINTSAPIRLYGISRISDGCPDPDVEDPPYLSPVCAEELIDASFADNLANLFDGNFNSFATINSSAGLLGTGVGAFSGHVTLGYGDGVIVPAGTTSYMRIDTDPALLDALLGGSVGGVLSDLLNTIVLGDHYFTIAANDAGGNPIFTASSDNSFAGFNDQVKIVQDELGRYYLAITPDSDYNSITVTDHTDALLLGQDNSINIYGLCYDTGAEACATGFTTSFDGSGIATLDAASIGGYGVTNAERALDNNNNDDYSEISLGALAVDASIQQNIQFRQTIPAEGSFKIKLGVGTGTVDAGVFGRIDVLGYLDGEEVYEETLDNAVLGNVNLVDLFNNGANEEIRVSLGVDVDEVAIRYRSLVSVSVNPTIRLYYILQDCETPDFQSWKSYIIDGDPTLTSVSGGETVQYTIHVRNTGTVPMTDYLITDAIPAHTTYVDGSGGVNNSGVITFENIDIAAGATETVSFSVLIEGDLTDVEFISNVALVKSLPEDPGTETFPPLDNENPTDPDESGDTGTDIPVDPIFSAEIWKAVSVDGDGSLTSVSGGETLVYTIYLRNTGNQDLTDVTITDALPAGITYVSGGTLNGNDVSFNLAGLAVGATATVGSFTATVEADLTGIDEIRNIAIASSADLTTPIESYPAVDNTNPTEPDTAADPGTVTDVEPVHSIEFDKIGLSNNAESDGKAIVGDIISYTLTVTNTGNKTLTDISVVDQLPANTTLVDNGGGTAGIGTLTFDIATLAVGAMQEFTFTVEVDAVSGSDPIVNNAEAFFTDAAGGSASETAQHSMPTDCMTIDAGDITLTADQSAICEGETTIMHASLNGISIPDPEFRWYLDASLTGTYFSGADFEVSPTASTTYYVTVVAEGYCFSTPAATSSITVNELPDVPSTSSDITISEGFGTVLTASIDPMPADVEIVWYAEGGAELATGSSYNTGVLSAGVYTYYAGTRNINTGCLSIDTTAVTVTVEPVTTDADCTIANAQNNGTYFLCLLCSVENPGNAVDGNNDSYSRFVAPVAVTGGVYQELIFNQTGTAGDTIVVTLGTGGSLLDLGVLSGLSFESYNGSSANGDGGVVDNNLISLSLLGGDSKGQIRFVAGGAFDRVRIEYRPLLGALESGWRIYQAEINYPAPTAITEDAEVCVGETATLEATPSAGTSLRWYDAETGGTLLASGNSYTTPALNVPGVVTYYIAVLRDGCEDPVRIPVDVTVNPGAMASDIDTMGGTICEGESFTLSATSSTVTNPVFRFFEDEDLTMEITNLTVSPATTTTYYVTVSGDGVCENAPGDAAEVVVTVNPNAVDADININDTVTQCEGEDVVLAPTTSIANPIFTWYFDAAKTNPIPDGDVFGIPFNLGSDGSLTISGLPAGSTNEYFVTVSGDGVCENEVAKSVSVTITNSLDAPEFVAEELEVCGTTADVTFEISNDAGGLTYTVYDAATGGNIVTDGIQILGDQIILASVDADVEYFVGVMGGSGCESMDRTRIAVTVLPPATAADISTTDIEICEGESAMLSATSSTVTNPEFKFYTSQDLTTEITDLEVNPTITTTYYVTVSGDGVCENAPGDAAELTVTVNPLPAAPGVGSSSVTITEGFSTQLVASAPAGSTVVWYSDAGVELSTGPTYMTPVLSQGTYTYFAASRDDVTGCESTDRTMITVVVIPATPIDDCTVANGQSIDSSLLCLLCFATTPEQAVDGNENTFGRLTVPLGILGSISQTLSFPTMGSAGDSVKIDLGIPGGLADVGLLSRIEITLFNGGTQVDQFSLNESLVNLTVLGGGSMQQASVLASASFDRVRISLTGVATVLTSLDIYQASIQFATPTAIAEDAEVCVGETATLEATPSAGTSLRWYDAETGGTLLASGNSYTTPALNVPGVVTYYIAVLRDGCEDPVRIPVEVTVNPGAMASDIDAMGGTICEGDSFMLSASSSTVTNPVFKFYTSQDLTTEITDLEVSPATTTTYYVTVSGDGVCENAPGDAAELVVTVNPRAMASDIDAMDGTICEGESFTLSASSSTVTNPVFKFYTSQDLTTEITDLEVSPATTTTYYVTVSGDGVCENAPGDAAELVVTVNPRAMASDIDAMGGTICEGDSFTLSASSSTVTNPVFKFYNSQDLTTEITDLEVSPATTTTYYVTVSGDGVCENAPGDAAELVVTVNPRAMASDIDAMGGTICEGESFTLSASSSTVTNPVFKFYTSQDLTTEITDLEVSPATTTTYYVTVSGDGVCENAPGDAAELVVTVNPRAMASDIDAVGGTICEGDSFTLSASSSTVTNPIFKFYTSQDLTTEITDLEVSPATTTTYYVTVSGDGVCENAPGDAAELVVTVNPRAMASDIDAMGGTICEGDSFTLSASSSTVTNPIFKFYTSQDLTTEITDLEVSPATTTTYYVTVSGDGVCENAPGDAAELVVTVNPSAMASDIDAMGGTICEGESFTLSASSSTVTNPVFKFYTSQDLTTEITDLEVSPAATTTYYVTVSGDGVCENAPGDAAELVVTVGPRAMASDIDAMGGTICEGDSFMLSASSSTVTNPVFKFYTSQDLTTEITDLEVSPATTTTYYVTVSGDGVCENAPGDAAELVVTVNPRAMASDIDAMDGTICEGESFTLSASSSTVTNPVFKFYTSQDLTTEITDLEVSPAATTTYYVTVSGDGVCENAPGDAAELVVTVNPRAMASDIDAMGGTICEGESFTLSATSSTVTNPVFRFFEDEDLTMKITNLTVSPGSTTTYYVTVSGDGVCENAPGDAAELVVTVGPRAMASDIDAMGGTICEGESFTLSASSSTVTNPVFKFYTSQDLTTEITDLEVSPAATTTYYVTVSGDGVCENAPGDAAELVVTVGPRAMASDIDAMGGTICEGESFTLSATSSTVTNPVFRFFEDEDLTMKITNLTVSPGSTTTYYVTVSGDGVCENAPGDAAELVVTVGPRAMASDIDAMGGTICEGESFTLSASSSTVTNPVFKFYTSQDLTTEITDLEVSPAATTTYYVTVSGDGVCENAPGDAAELVVTVGPRAMASDIDAMGGTICEGDSFMLSASSSTVINPVFKFYTSQDLTTEITDLEVSPATTTTYYVTVSGDGVCENAPGDAAELVVNVGREALSSDVQVMNAVICEGESTMLTATSSTVTNPVFRFYTDEKLTEEVVDLNVSPAVTTRYYVTVTGDEVCESKSEEAAHLTVTVRTTPAPEVSDPTQTFCSDTENPTVGSLLASGNNIRWYESAVGGLPLDPASPLVDGMTYYATQTDPMTSCESMDRVSVNVVLTLCDRGEGLQITKNAGSPTVLPGGEITYTIGLVNTSAFAMNDVEVTDVLATELSFVSATEGGQFENGTVTWMIDEMAPREVVSLSLTVSVPMDIAVGTIITNVAVVESPDDPDTPKESDPEEVEVVQAFSYTIEKVPNVTEAAIGDQVIYTINVANISEVVKEDIQVTDILPMGLAFVSADQGGLSNNGVVFWVIPSLAVGQNIDLTLVAEVTDEVEVGDIIYNTAVVDDPNDTEDPIESDPGDGVEVIESTTEINITKTQDATEIFPGEILTYTLTLENLGENLAKGLVVTDTLPQGTMLVETSPEGTVNGDVVTWNIESLEAGESIALELKVMVVAEEGSIINKVTVEGDNFPDDSDQTDPVTIEDPVNEVDLVLDKEVSASLIQLNTVFEYKITLTNNSENTSNGVVVTDVFSTSVEYLGADVSSGAVSYNQETRTLTWSIPTVGPLAVETMTIRVTAISEGVVSNTATATSEDEELEPSDNADTVTHEQLVFEIPNVFTPNGDGINDTWNIPGLEEFFPQNELVVVNRWGVEVYRATNYQSDWNGDNLNGGTYYYQFQLTDSQGVGHIMTGYVTIIK